MESKADNRFFATTRGKVVMLLRTSEQTVDELAATLGLTDNGVRGHLAALEADGYVQRGSPRKGASKPAQTYRLSPTAERLFPKAYGSILNRLLRTITERLPANQMQDVFREVGHQLPAPERAPSPDAIPQQALDLIAGLGGSARIEESDGFVRIVGTDCPIAAAVNANPDACLIAETLLSDSLGVPVRQMCDHGDPPRCRFEFPKPSN